MMPYGPIFPGFSKKEVRSNIISTLGLPKESADTLFELHPSYSPTMTYKAPCLLAAKARSYFGGRSIFYMTLFAYDPKERPSAKQVKERLFSSMTFGNGS